MADANLQEFTKQQFDEAYRRALERKRLFKEYLARHQVMERLNSAIEKLYECERLPEDPLEFIAVEVTSRGSQGATSAPFHSQTSLKAKLSGNSRSLNGQQ
ncbi:hypothetical protein VOLCADRAFT_104181 [Volvox carteri f. nagariensis]|uniref:Uncharacterized protein n=1 Tax=Volvox carteri f. nagariensis TaxID=3068 RepID=D8TRZ4_VOLCA|nr:uncharacterized protein VOLCADRAFT_104181 [Volvox carteri f. nagariensis]EFJ49736.1 hypothetical protein VOLCADRAFT_104181 [Volvox carteri f. nagariensis]|eukprot:XP_002949243.1 hypothetical protein VOLCADRAFT_104181 [Volvox carteri f. nagariensis]